MFYKKNFCFLFLIVIYKSYNLFLFSNSFTNDFKGPLISKNTYPLYMIFQNIPGISAKIIQNNMLNINTTLYYSQAFMYYKYTKDPIKLFRACDFEQVVIEHFFSYSFLNKFEFFTFFRLNFYYGGILDNFTQNWHFFFKFPNGGREYAPQNEVVIDINTNNNLNLKLNKETFGFGDIDIFFKYNFLNLKKVNSSLLTGLKIPSGSIEYVTGSETFDISFSLLFDFYLFKNFGFYIQNGIVFPIRENLYPMFNSITSFEFILFKYLSFLFQINIKTSSVYGDYYVINNLGINANLFQSPQTNLLIGLIYKYQNIRIQFFFEEDTFTNIGNDYTFGISFGYNKKLY